MDHLSQACLSSSFHMLYLAALSKPIMNDSKLSLPENLSGLIKFGLRRNWPPLLAEIPPLRSSGAPLFRGRGRALAAI